MLKIKFFHKILQIWGQNNKKLCSKSKNRAQKVKNCAQKSKNGAKKLIWPYQILGTVHKKHFLVKKIAQKKLAKTRKQL